MLTHDHRSPLTTTVSPNGVPSCPLTFRTTPTARVKESERGSACTSTPNTAGGPLLPGVLGEYSSVVLPFIFHASCYIHGLYVCMLVLDCVGYKDLRLDLQHTLILAYTGFKLLAMPRIAFRGRCYDCLASGILYGYMQCLFCSRIITCMYACANCIFSPLQ